MNRIHRKNYGMAAIALGLMLALGACASDFEVTEDDTSGTPDTFTLSTDGGASTTFSESGSDPSISASVITASSVMEIIFAETLSGTVYATLVRLTSATANAPGTSNLTADASAQYVTDFDTSDPSSLTFTTSDSGITGTVIIDSDGGVGGLVVGSFDITSMVNTQGGAVVSIMSGSFSIERDSDQ